MAVVEAQKVNSTSSNFKTANRLAVVVKGSSQHYPTLSPSKRGVKVAVIAQGTKLVLSGADDSIRKTQKIFGQLFP